MSAEFWPTSERRNHTNRLTPPSTSSVSSRSRPMRMASSKPAAMRVSIRRSAATSAPAQRRSRTDNPGRIACRPHSLTRPACCQPASVTLLPNNWRRHLRWPMTSLVVHFCSAPLVCFVDALDTSGGISPTVVLPTLDIGRAYSATDAAAILGITPYVLNERFREGWIKPIFETGDRRYSGYVLAQLLGWPLKDNLLSDLPAVQRQLLLPVPSIILAGSPPVSDYAAGPLRCGSWGRRIPG